MNKAGPIITVAIGLVLIVVIAWRFGETNPSPGTGASSGPGFPAPAAGGITLSGQRWNVQDQRGKVVLLDFWATWCPPCLAAMPEIRSIRERFRDREDFVLVGVSLDYTKRSLESYLRKNAIDWLQIFDGDANAELARAFGVDAIPAVFLIDRSGHARRIGLNADETIAEIEKLLQTRE